MEKVILRQSAVRFGKFNYQWEIGINGQALNKVDEIAAYLLVAEIEDVFHAAPPARSGKTKALVPDSISAGEFLYCSCAIGISPGAHRRSGLSVVQADNILSVDNDLSSIFRCHFFDHFREGWA